MSKFQLVVFRRSEYVNFLGKWQLGTVTSRNQFVRSTGTALCENVTRKRARTHMVTLWLEGRYLQWHIWFMFVYDMISDSHAINIDVIFNWVMKTVNRLRTGGVALQFALAALYLLYKTMWWTSYPPKITVCIAWVKLAEKHSDDVRSLAKFKSLALEKII